MSMTTAFAAYKESSQWLALPSIRSTERGALEWIMQNYIGGLSQWRIVPVEVRRKRTKIKKRTARR